MMQEINKILILFAHPAFSRSVVQKAMHKTILSLDGITVHDLYSCYPDFIIDPDQEQKLLSEHDIIVFQHPLFWYSTPSILKEWQDIVLEHHYAYGKGGDRLKGKKFFHALSMGAGIEQYQTGQLSDMTFAELLSPTRMMARLTQMHWYPPFIVDGIIEHDISTERLYYVCEDYRRLLIAMRDGLFDFSLLDNASHINAMMNKAIQLSTETA